MAVPASNGLLRLLERVFKIASRTEIVNSRVATGRAKQANPGDSSLQPNDEAAETIAIEAGIDFEDTFLVEIPTLRMVLKSIAD